MGFASHRGTRPHPPKHPSNHRSDQMSILRKLPNSLHEESGSSPVARPVLNRDSAPRDGFALPPSLRLRGLRGRTELAMNFPPFHGVVGGGLAASERRRAAASPRARQGPDHLYGRSGGSVLHD